MNIQKPIFYSWDNYVADILTRNISHELWKRVGEISTSGIVKLPCIFNEVDPKIDKHRKRPIGNANLDIQTVYFCLTHFNSKIVNRNLGVPLCCNKSNQKTHCVVSKDYKTFNIDNMFMGVWCALPPAMSTEKINQEKPFVHVHVRENDNTDKIIDCSFEAIVLQSKNFSNCNSYNEDFFSEENNFLEVEVTPPSIFSLCLSYYKKTPVHYLTCNYCHAWHTDLGIFSKPHKKHLCGSCGYFFDVDLPVSCSNALATLPNNWSSNTNRRVIEASEKISINSSEYDRVDIWSWSPAAVWTMQTPEIINGIHIHAYKNGHRIIDETFGHVEFDGQVLKWQDLLIRSLLNCEIKDKHEIISEVKNALR